MATYCSPPCCGMYAIVSSQVVPPIVASTSLVHPDNGLQSGVVVPDVLVDTIASILNNPSALFVN